MPKANAQTNGVFSTYAILEGEQASFNSGSVNSLKYFVVSQPQADQIRPGTEVIHLVQGTGYALLYEAMFQMVSNEMEMDGERDMDRLAQRDTEVERLVSNGVNTEMVTRLKAAISENLLASPLVSQQTATEDVVAGLDKALSDRYVNMSVLVALVGVEQSWISYPVFYANSDNYIWGVAPPASGLRLSDSARSSTPFRFRA